MAEPGLSARYAREVSEKASTCSSLRTAAASAVVRQWRDQNPARGRLETAMQLSA